MRPRHLRATARGLDALLVNSAGGMDFLGTAGMLRGCSNGVLKRSTCVDQEVPAGSHHDLRLMDR